MLNICFNGGELTLLKLSLPMEKSTYGYEELDWGHIHPKDFDAAREEVFSQAYPAYSKAEIKQLAKEARERHNTIIKAAKNHEDLRIWCAGNPATQCGLFYTMHSLKGIDCRIFVVDMPNNIGLLPPDHDKSWAEVEPEDVESCLCLQREVSMPEREFYEQIWEMFANENAELRVNINGRITSVPIDYFDDEILSNAPINTDFKLGILVGEALRCPRYLNPAFIEYRIKVMIDQGKITLVKRSHIADFDGAAIIRVERR